MAVNPPTISPNWLNIVNSIHYYLRNFQYNKYGILNTIVSRYGLNLDLAFPEDFTKIVPPLLVIEPMGIRKTEHKTFQSVSRDYSMLISFFGGGKAVEGGHAKKRQLNEIMNDLMEILNLPTPGQNMITLYDFNSGTDGNRTNIGSLEILNTDANIVEGLGANLDVEKYRFELSMELKMIQTF